MASNPYVNKVEANGQTLIDLTADTAVASDVAQGKYFHLASGERVQGTSQGGGGSSAHMDDPIRFFDYEGTLVASYKTVPASLPSVPTHAGLTNGTWNYTLAEVSAQFGAMGTCDVGANYETESGATEIYLELDDPNLLSLCLTIAVQGISSYAQGTATVDWGDGSEASTVTGASLTSSQHTDHSYPSVGSYVIKIYPTSGTYSLYTSASYGLISPPSGSSTGNSNSIKPYTNCVKAARIGTKCNVGNYAFYYCYSLEYVSIPNGANFGASLFQFCYNLKHVTVPKEIRTVYANTFAYCYSMTSVSLPASVTGTLGSVFFDCHSLRTLSLPHGMTGIGATNFSNMYNIEHLKIPDSVTSFTSTFYNCYLLRSIELPASVNAFKNQMFYNCMNLQQVPNLDTVESVEAYAYYGCSSLKSAAIPSGSASVPQNLFQNCKILKVVEIPSSVTSIGASAFNGCTCLTSMTVPSGVTSIGANAFGNCDNIVEHHMEPTTPPTLANINAFNGINQNCVIYVPQGSLEAYQTATNWSTYASKMQEEPS